MTGHKGRKLPFLRYQVFICNLLSVIFILFLLASCGKKGELTLKSYEKPASPSGLMAIHRESDIMLFWNFPKDKETLLKGFHVMRSTDGDFEKIAFVENNNRSYIDTNFNVGSEYKYKIISQNLRDIISNDSNIIKIMPGTPPPPPLNISFEIERDSVRLSWESTGNGILYNIYKSNEKNKHSLIPLNKEPVSDTFFTDNLNIKKPVYYRIRSLAGTDIRDEGPASEELAIDPMEFALSPPEKLHSVVTEENVYLIWKEVPDIWVIGYRVYRETNNREGFVLIGETQTPAFLDKDKPATKRNYRVASLSASKESIPAEIKNIIFAPQRKGRR
ncbi:MAG: hypothetical protein A2Y97_05855 [Nitrospirae bacterium RBG_13_39_12]|nr:MAG: hypothetical protein A2Y97_05855 [Nitrospirae bacterium RBG_13_39_12]